MFYSVKYVTLIFLIIFVAGCQTLRVSAPESPYIPYTPEKEEVSQNKIDPIWDKIKQRKIDTREPLSLVKLIDIALHNNPSTHEAWKNARAASAVQGQAESQWLPQGGVSGTVTRQNKIAHQEHDDLDLLQYGPSIKLTYLIFDFGGRSAEVEAASQMLLAANFQFNQAIQDLLLNVEKAYYELYSTQIYLEAKEADLADAKTAYNAAEQKYDTGLASKLDLLQEKSNYDNAVYSLEDAKGNLKTAEVNLMQLLGMPADTDFQIAEPNKELPKDITREDVKILVEEALKNRPDIKALRATLKAKEAVVKAANSAILPTINIGGDASKNWYRYYNENNLKTDDYGYSGYLSINWDIFNGIYNFNKKLELKAQKDASLDQLIQTELEASASVWTSYYTYNTAVKQLISSEAFLENAQTSYDYALEGYNAGLKSMLDLLQAQSALSDARSNLIQSRKDLFFAIADLAHSTGSITIPKTTTTQIKTDIDNNNIPLTKPIMNFVPRK